MEELPRDAVVLPRRCMYKEVWEAAVGKVLICEREPDNASDRYVRANISYRKYFAGLIYLL